MNTTHFMVLLCVAGCAGAPARDGGIELEPVTMDAGVDAGTPDAGPFSTPELYETQLATSFCAKIFGCCTASEIQSSFGGLTDEPSCRAMWLARFAQRRDFFETSIDAGRLGFAPDQATQCIADVATLACPDFNRWFGPQSCAQVYAGRVADGEACVLTEDCGSVNGSCLEVDAGMHRCVAAIGAGAPCGEEFGRCRPGTRCVGNSTTGRPVCVQELPLGSPCVVGSQCTSQTCGSSDTCEPTPKYCG